MGSSETVDEGFANKANKATTDCSSVNHKATNISLPFNLPTNCPNCRSDTYIRRCFLRVHDVKDIYDVSTPRENPGDRLTFKACHRCLPYLHAAMNNTPQSSSSTVHGFDRAFQQGHHGDRMIAADLTDHCCRCRCRSKRASAVTLLCYIPYSVLVKANQAPFLVGRYPAPLTSDHCPVTEHYAVFLAMDQGVSHSVRVGCRDGLTSTHHSHRLSRGAGLLPFSHLRPRFDSPSAAYRLLQNGWNPRGMAHVNRVLDSTVSKQ